jgi:uncharacterized protein YyaL (SSP411 family)
LGNKSFLESAIKAARFIQTEMNKTGGGYFHTWKNGIAKIPAFLDDYSFLAEAFLHLYQYTMDHSWLKEAERIIEYILQNFSNKESDFFFFSEEDHHNVIRKEETNDSVTPSSNSSLARILHTLGTFTSKSAYIEISGSMLKAMNHRILNYPLSSANWACVAMELGMSHHVIAIVGEDAEVRIDEMSRHFLPNTLIIGSTGPSDLAFLKGRFIPGETHIHICTENACFAPVDTVDKALMLLNAHLGISN